ncbi:unannotated protein [freshwater metagenome]|uniref:Unannotated protein n=1 Tax=freshwater metagenome TaxID=449393 RepID=A0A6J7DQH1_9ZZZZ
MLIQTVRAVPEGETGHGVAPRDLALRSVVADRAYMRRATEPAEVVLAVACGPDESKRAVGGYAGQRIGERVANVVPCIGDHVRAPHVARVVQHRLVVEGKVAGPHHPAATGNANVLDTGGVERRQRLDRDLGGR